MKKQLLVLVMMVTIVGMTGCTSEKQEADEGHLSDVITISADAIKNAAIETLVVTEKATSGQLKSIAEIRANDNRVFHINPPVSGRVVEDRVLLGDVVKQGQVVAVLQNVEVAKVNAQFIHEYHQNEIDIRQAKIKLTLAKKNLEREKRLLEEGISPRKDYFQAETEYELAKSALAGLNEHAIHIRSEAQALLGAYGSTLKPPHAEDIDSNSIIVAPRSGIITKKTITLGDMVNPEETLYEVADLNQVWLDITLYPKDIERVKLAQKVTFTSDAIPEKTFSGAINYLQPAASDTSQTFMARVFLDNPGLILKPGVLGQVVIQTDAYEPQPFIPETAVQTYGKESFVFLVTGKGQFQKRTVELGDKVANGYLVKNGLKAGDTIVAQGSFTLKAEMLKSQFAEEE